MEKNLNLRYIDGALGSGLCSEALEGALPEGQNSPQVCPYGLYAEQLSGTAFTAPRHKNLRSWLYRIRPSVLQSPFKEAEFQPIFEDHSNLVIDPNQMRWNPPEISIDSNVGVEVDFVDGLQLMCSSGDASMKEGLSIYQYLATISMVDKAFYNSDGDFLIVPQLGSLNITTEFGKLHVSPKEIIVIPRGIKFSIHLDISDAPFCRGYVLEINKGHFELPGLGPIGANGLANPRDFKAPVAWFEDVDFITKPTVTIDTTDSSDLAETRSYKLVNKFIQKLFVSELNYSPFNVVAWHGNYFPFKYDLTKFNCMNTVSFDHPDPSIYTVLTCPSDEAGVAVADFVIFPPRWMVAEHTFRPPYFHRNCMSEYMGMIYGRYDAKSEGFSPGGSSLHNCMTSHGPDSDTFTKASTVPNLTPIYFNEGLAFMFESTFMLKVSPRALESSARQFDYPNCWNSPPLPKLFNGSKVVDFGNSSSNA